MVTIDDEGNKINRQVEHCIDTTTNDIVEIEHSTILAKADDEEHWMSRTTYKASELDEGATICTMFIYAAEDVRESIEKLLGPMRLVLGSHHRLAKKIPLPQLMRVLVGDSKCEGLILEATMIHADIFTLIGGCQLDSAEALRDALFEIFPNFDYIKIVY